MEKLAIGLPKSGAFSRRRSVKAFGKDPLQITQKSQLLQRA